MNKILSSIGVWKILLFPVVVVIGIILSGIFMVKPLVLKLNDYRVSIENDQKKLDFLINKITQLKRLDFELVAQRLTLMERSIPSSKDALLGISVVRSVAEMAGLSIDNLSVAPGKISTGSAATTGEAFEKGLPIQLSVAGSPESIKQFIAKFSEPTFPLFIPRLTSISYQGSTLNLSMTLSMLWKPVPSSFGGDDRAVRVLSASEESFVEALRKYVPAEEIVEEVGGVLVEPRATLF